MTWFKVDDSSHSHPKIRRAGLQAMGLWNVSGSYAGNYNTGGFVPEWFVLGWSGGKKSAEKLVEVGLWKEGQNDSEQGWWFHDWEDFQPSPEEVELEREANRERQRRWRERRREMKRNGS